jgi:hypothetical protein
MEWLILLSLVPAIVAPVVVLYGFAGCVYTPPPPAPVPPADPTNVRVDSKDLDRITLKWDYLDAPPLPVTFEVEINDLNTDPPSQTFARDIPQTTREFPHTGLQAGKVFEYRVRAVQATDPRESNFVPNPPLRAATLSFQTAFGPITLANNDGGNDGSCTVQRIEPASLLLGGTLPVNNRVRITLRGPTAGGLTLDLVTISRAAVPGDDPNNPTPDLYDSGPDRTQLAAAVVVPTNGIHVVPPVGYQLNKNVPLLIAFDINDTAGQGTLRFVGNVPAGVATMYSLQNTDEAATNNRTAGYNTQSRIHIVERIEVVAETPLS